MTPKLKINSGDVKTEYILSAFAVCLFSSKVVQTDRNIFFLLWSSVPSDVFSAILYKQIQTVYNVTAQYMHITPQM